MTPPLAARSALVLVIDTSLVGVAMALTRVEDGRSDVLWNAAHAANAGSVSAISGLLTRGLTTLGQRLEALGGIVVSPGPGSFTGIKVGLAFVMGLRRAPPGGMPVLAVAAVSAAAERLGAELGKGYAVLLPATRTHGFIAVTGAPPRLIDAGAVDAAATLKALVAGKPLAVVGAWPLAESRAREAGLSVLQVHPSEVSRQAIYGMSEEAGRLWPAGFGARTPEPQYLRLSTAEERLAGARGDGQ